jgi:CHAT domain-containing protein/Tfp pilus assembly protein PilF
MKQLAASSFFLFICFTVFAQDIPEIYWKVEERYNKSEFEACVALAGQVDQFVAGRVDTLAANTLFYVADAYNQVGESDKAIAYHVQEKNLWAQIGNLEYYGVSLYNLASVYLQAGKYGEASSVANELLTLEKKINKEESPEYAESILNVADIYIQTDRLKEAENLLLGVLKKQPRNTVSYGKILNKLGDLYNYTGQFLKASRVLQEATDVLFVQAGEESAEYISAAINHGVLYMGQGKYPEAEEIFDVALSLLDPQSVSYPAVLNNLGLVYQSLGQLDRAEATFQKLKAMDSVAIGINHPDYAITLSNLGQILSHAGKYVQAERVILQALDIQKKNSEESSFSYGITLNNLAKIYLLSGKPEKAIAPLQQAAGVFKKTVTENHPEYANSMFNLGNAFWKAGKGKEGIKYLKTSATIRAKVLGKRHPKYAESIQKIAEYQWEQKQTKEAHESFGQVFENIYFQVDVTFPGLTEEEKSRFFYSNIKDSFEKFNSFAVRYASEDPVLIGEMYNYHINTKGAIMSATEKVRQAIHSSKDTVLIHLFENWQGKKEQIARAFSHNEDAQKIDSLIQEASKLEKDLTKKSAAFAGQFDRKKYTWQEIQKALQPGEASVEVLRYKVYTPVAGGSFTEDIAYAFLIVTGSSKTPQLIVVNKGKDMESKFLKFYHNSVKYNLDDTYSFKNFFEPLADVLQANKITKCYFSPDGVYNQLNLNSIYNPLTKKFLLDDYDFRFVTNSRELVEVNNPVAANSTSVLIGFPKFNLDKGTANSNASSASSKVTRSGNLTRGMRGLLRFMRGQEGITELPGTQKEIQQISSLFKNNPKVFLAHEASEDIAKGVQNPTYLHIATHGYFLEDEDLEEQGTYVTNPLLKAGLILAGSENFILNGRPVNDAGDDGILTAYEAMNLKLDETKLVVLSACETGLGQVKNGEGVYGLQRAFKIAGAQSIVMSLWSVDDEATQELMSTFYSELLRTGKQHESFRTAQQKIKEKYNKPFYWGAFIMVGI